MFEPSTAIRYYTLKVCDAVVINTHVNVPSDYLRPLVQSAFDTVESRTNIVFSKCSNNNPQLVWDEYENIDWDRARKDTSLIVSSYCHRKGTTLKKP